MNMEIKTPKFQQEVIESVRRKGFLGRRLTAVPMPWHGPGKEACCMEGLNPEDTAAHAALLENEEGEWPFRNITSQNQHNLDGRIYDCVGEKEGCWLCVSHRVLVVPGQPQVLSDHPPSWNWYAKFLLKYAAKEALACRQKLWEYGFSLSDVFLPIESLKEDGERAGWWRVWLEQGYMRHGKAVYRLLSGFTQPGLRVSLHRRIADWYGYSSIGMARLKAMGDEDDGQIR